jgi:hypothetical protein
MIGTASLLAQWKRSSTTLVSRTMRSMPRDYNGRLFSAFIGSLLMPRILLAPMEGLADDPLMRNVLTAIGGYDWGICEFIRVTGSVLPVSTFLRTCPELLSGSRTPKPVRRCACNCSAPTRISWPRTSAGCVTLKHRPAGIDINFGCPAPTVFRHRGGSPRCSASRNCCTPDRQRGARGGAGRHPVDGKDAARHRRLLPRRRLRAGALKPAASTN